MTARDFDTIVVGSGPGGATAADELTRAGRSVVIFERGHNYLIGTASPYDLMPVFSNDELKYTIRHFLGPDPWLEPRTFRRTESDGDRLIVGEVNNLPATVGGGGVHADGKLCRFREDDFRVLSELGPVDAANVADWPLSYADLEPYYAAAERLIGTAGLAGANPLEAWRSGPYPMPPGPPMYASSLSAAAAERLGYHPYPAPTGVNSVPYDGRPACNNCGFCSYFGCPIHAKGGAAPALRRALLSGRAELRPDAFVSKILLRGGRATGVEWIDAAGDAHEELAGNVVVAAGAMETPRLLLLSGFTNPNIGRNLMFHMQTYAFGEVSFRVHGHMGRSVTHVHDDHALVDDRARQAARSAGLPWIKGGIVEHCTPANVIAEAKLYPWGPQHRRLMRESQLRDHFLGLLMQGEDLPQAANRVDLDPSVRDVRGLPVARTTYKPHRHEIVAAEHHGDRLAAIIREAGAYHVIVVTSPTTAGEFAGAHPDISVVPVSRHVAGTARMGSEPATSVCDEWGRLWEAPNVLIADSSLFPTMSGYGPTLTLVALASRNVHAFLGRQPLRAAPAAAGAPALLPSSGLSLSSLSPEGSLTPEAGG
jgi:choline dehydrogenase-like flavoprotein